MSQLNAIVIDDNELSRTVLADILKERQIRVTTYADQTDFLTACGSDCRCKQKPCCDIILTDNRMHMMNGLTFLARLDAMSCCVPKAHTAIISGDWSDEDIEKAQQLGCVIFDKPCNIDQLYSWVDDISADIP